MEKVVAFNQNTEEALRILDDLRVEISNGTVVAFAAVGIRPNDETAMWSSCTKFVSRLRMIGGIYGLLQHYTAGDA